MTDFRSFAAAQDDNRSGQEGGAVILREPATEESIIDFALEHNPGIRIAQWQQLNAKRQLNTAKWQLLPTIGLYAGWSTSYYTYQGSPTAVLQTSSKTMAANTWRSHSKSLSGTA